MTREEAIKAVMDAVEKPEDVVDAIEVLRTEPDPVTIEKPVVDESMKEKYEKQVEETERLRERLRGYVTNPMEQTPTEANDEHLIELNFKNFDLFSDRKETVKPDLRFSGINE